MAGGECFVVAVGRLPVVVTVSLQSDVVLDLHTPPPAGSDDPTATPTPLASLLLRRRSLMALRGDAYSAVWHGIAARDGDEVGSGVANLQPGDELGERIPRAGRVSLVFVRKM